LDDGMNDHDAVVIGTGPNGLAAAIELARAGHSVLVREAADTIGGGLRSGELTLPGFVHDVCSAIHPMAAASPFFRTVPLGAHGLEWIEPPVPLAHPLDGGEAAVLRRSVEETAEPLGPDAEAYARVFRPLVANWPRLEEALLGPLVRIPRHPFALARFGLGAIWPATRFARRSFDGEPARALFAGLAAHSILSLDKVASASFGLVLGLTGHAVGWPLPRGGSQAIADALASYLRSLGGEIVTGAPVESLEEVRGARIVLCDVTPRQLLRLAGDRLGGRYRRALEHYRYGPGVFKLDWALSGPIPWAAAKCAEASTVHLGGTLDEIAASERAPGRGETSERPFVLLAQPTMFDPSRAPEGRHTAWAYCHVPNGSTVDMTEAIEQQVERFAPGFGERVLARNVMGPADLERRNANLVGGDIAGGSNELRQLIGRPALRPVPYSTPLDGVYLCSASTPPGGGVHGMCGYLAARAALRAARAGSSPGSDLGRGADAGT
jgi:phytoene dehydrogenase-like protein